MKIVENCSSSFYSDWTVPEGYFTLKGRDVPNGCEEISEEERRKRDNGAVECMEKYFEKSLESPDQHPDAGN